MTAPPEGHFLGREPILPLLLRMGIPAAVGMMVNALYNVVDTIFVGHGVGPTAIAALAVVFPIQMVASAFAHALSFGTASIVSRRLGEQKPGEAVRALGSTYAAVTVVTALLVVLAFAFMEPILRLFGATPTILPYATQYLRIVGAGFFFFSLSMCASTLARAEGDARASMIGMVLGAGLNAVLDPLFIFGFRMGVSGAAAATVISQAASCLYLFSRYFRGKGHLPLTLRHFRIRWNLIRESAILGVPAFVQNAGMSLLALLVNTTLGEHGGDEAITLYGMNHKIDMIVILPVIGIAQGLQPIAGYNFGARQFGRVRESLRAGILAALGLALAGYGFLMLAPRAAVALFTADADLIAKGSRALRLMVLLLPAAAVQITSSTYFQAIGRSTQAFVLGVSRQFLLLIPLVLTLPRFLGVDGIWVSFPLADLLSSVLTLALLAGSVRHLGECARASPPVGRTGPGPSGE